MRVIIVGSGIAGITAARTIREQSPDTKIEIYTEEEDHYYPRPQLIELLAERVPLERVFLYNEQWYRDRGIAIHLRARVEGLEPERGQIILRNGAKAGYDRLLLATGARPHLPQIPGIEHEGIFTLRTVRDALALKGGAQGAKELLVIGGGLLGLEAARAICAATGARAYVLERREWPLSRQLDRQSGELLMERLREMDVEIITAAQSKGILGDGRVREVELADGRTIEGDLVLITTGIQPNSELAQQAGLKVNRGVTVDQHLQTSAPEVYAAGDVAEFKGRIYGIIPAALDQARTAALNIVGQEAKYRGTVPFNTLQVAGIELFSVGEINPQGEGYEEQRLRDEERGIYKRLVFKDGKLVGAILLGTKKNSVQLARLIASGRDLADYKQGLLADDFDFKGLLG